MRKIHSKIHNVFRTSLKIVHASYKKYKYKAIYVSKINKTKKFIINPLAENKLYPTPQYRIPLSSVCQVDTPMKCLTGEMNWDSQQQHVFQQQIIPFALQLTELWHIDSENTALQTPIEEHKYRVWLGKRSFLYDKWMILFILQLTDGAVTHQASRHSTA